MAYAISAWFDTKFESNVRGIWHDLHEAGISSYMHNGPYRPHVTLAIFDSLNVQAFSSDLKTLAARTEALEVSFPFIGVFTTGLLASFLGVTVTLKILPLHQEIHELMSRHGQGPTDYYLPGNWIPHCTLAPDLNANSLPECVRLLQTLQLPLEATITRLGIIDTPAEIELESIPLRIP